MHTRSEAIPTVGGYEAALRFLYGRIDYERVLSVPYRKCTFRLDRMRRLLARLGSPHQRLQTIHVAGTKGKGSTAAMLSSILRAAGYRTGLYTSPHLDRLEERMAIDGTPCSPEELVWLVERVVPVVEAMDREAAGEGSLPAGPTYFEITTAMALLHFARRAVDLAILEVGLGGRLDSTNVCYPCVSVITSISRDHTRQLGRRLESIAWEKAGIVKRGVAVVSGVAEGPAREVIRSVCRYRGAPLVELGRDFQFDYRPPRHLESAPSRPHMDFWFTEAAPEGYRDLALGLVGRHQAANAAVAIAVVHQLRQAGWQVPEEAVRSGLARTCWPARVEVVGRRPAIVMDAAHNEASVAALINTLQESFSVSRRYLLFATTQEKDAPAMIARLVRYFDEIVFTRYDNNPRAMSAQSLADLAAAATGRRYPVMENPLEAWNYLRRLASPEDLICVSGSFFIAAQLREHIREQTAGCSPIATAH